ncbi:hypothetical protein ABZ990_16835 [Streptomyces sp. NPDC046203]|uniref:hypothetical protein n=1 Tax=Streptomyces sp. NPDC046203 TaxID=3154602 RepID=UPI0033F04C16
MLGGAGILLAAGPAAAAEVSYPTECVPPAVSGLPPVEGTTSVRLTAPAEATVGDEVEVVWTTVAAASKNPDFLDLEKDTVQPSGVVRLGGAASGTLTMTGPRENPPIPKNSPMILSVMKGTLKPTEAGEITLTPDAYTINVSKPLPTDTKCSPKAPVAPAATIKVSAGGGTTTSGGTTASGGTTTSGGTAGGGGTAASGGTSSSGGASGSSGGTSGTSGTSGTTSSTGGSSGSTGTSTSGSGGSSGGSGGGRTDFPGTEVAVSFACQAPGPSSITSKVTIGAKKNGGSYALTVKTAKGVMDSPAALPKGALKPSMDVRLGGADSGSVKVTGPGNPEPLEAGKPVDLTDMTGTYTPGATGRTTLAPGKLTISVSLGGTPIVIPCEVKGSAGASLTLDTEKQAGGASGGTTSGTSGTGGTSGATGGSGSTGGGLAETGAADHGTLRALALVAGTVILLGGAVFTFTPWARLRR